MKSKTIVYILLAIIVIVFHEFILAMGYMIYLTSKQIIINDIPETFNTIIYKNDNRKAYEEYIKSNYGIVSETFELKSHYNRFWHISAPFMEKEFSIQLVKGKVAGDTFSTVLSTDPKFQHLYSEWVKKEVGIEDENVELGFAGNFDTPYIEFNKITSLSDDYREVFENTHNLYCWLCEVSNIKDLTDNNKYEIAKLIREKYLLKAINKCKMPSDKKFGGRIYLSNSENAREKGKSYVFDFDINNINDNISEMKCRKLE